jgi:hypothetical protein
MVAGGGGGGFFVSSVVSVLLKTVKRGEGRILVFHRLWDKVSKMYIYKVGQFIPHWKRRFRGAIHKRDTESSV